MPEGSLCSSNDAPMSEESSRLSSASISSNERAPSATSSDSSELPSSDQRPASLISTLSSGSGCSRDDPSSTQTLDANIDPDWRGRSLGLIHNNKEAPLNRGSSRTSSPFVTSTMAPNPQLTYLDRVVMEIIETERTYVRDLRMIVEDYLARIIDQSDLSIHPEQVCALFGNIEDIYEFNSDLLQALDLCDSDPVAIARCFVEKSEYFEIYTQYCTNYPNSVATLTECMRNKSLAKFFRDRQSTLKRSLPLGSYLLKPVQRILKYHLLLQEIAKHFDPEEDGYEVVEEAIYTMTGVAWYINDMKRKHEHAVRLQEVQSLLLNWKGPDLTTYGELVLEGTFKVYRAKNERTLFLFDRMLLITKRRGEHFVYKTHISCSTLMLIESSKDSLSFSVIHYKHPKQPHTVQAKTIEEKKLWAHHIKRLILENHQAIIPQKAKDAILEMDSLYPPRYRYSPERLKKAVSSQSELIKVTLKSTKDVSKDAEAGGVPSNGSSKENQQIPEGEPGEAEPTSLPLSTDNIPKENMPEFKPMEDLQTEPSIDPDPPNIPVSLISERDPEPTEEPSPATPDSDAKTLSSGESSEDEEKGTPEKEDETTSILPSSVLDQASAIALHFTNSIKRGSQAQDAASSLGCCSPRLPSRTNSSLSLAAEPTDRAGQLNSICSDLTEAFNATDLTTLSPRDDNIFDANRGIHRRRESTLSKQDQLLIGKIKSYYETAGNQDASWSLQRRESLTYIPTGLVRSSVSRLNSIPKNEPVQTNVSTSVASSTLEPPLSTATAAHVVSTDGLDSWTSEQRSTDPEVSREGLITQPEVLESHQFENEQFRPSSEMIRIWLAMERDIGVTQREDRGHGQSKEASRTAKAAALIQTKSQSTSGDPESGADPSTATGESTSTSSSSQSERLRNALKVFGEKAQIPRVAQLKAEAEGPRPGGNRQDDGNRPKSKVLHLARQYSQRIRPTLPVVRQQSQKNLPCVVEEKESPDKPNLNLPLHCHNKASSLPLSPTNYNRSPAASLTCSSPVSPSRARSRSPLSPSEGFDWPDVRELRCRYSDRGRSQKNAISRSHSTPDQMSDGVRRHSSCSSSLHLTVPLYKARQEEHSKRLHRANSLDPRLSAAQMTELQKLQDQASNGNYDGYYVAAEAPLPNDPEHKILVVEKLPETKSAPAETTKESKEEEDDNYVQIRSPTSREKISIMAVIDRCRAYQESDEYKQREEAKAKTESDKTSASSTDQHDGRVSQKARASSALKAEAGQRSIVKNMREKFQSLS